MEVMLMQKTDYKKELSELYKAKSSQPVIVIVAKMNFLMIDGKGDPNTSEEYIDAIQALYPVAYTIKFICKAKGLDFSVMPLEGLWWSDNMEDFITGNKSNWQWTAMIMQPNVVTKEIFDQAVNKVAEKQNPKSLKNIRLEPYEEGRSAQIMYIGPYSNEGPTIQKLHQYIKDQGGLLTNKNKHHHEIYLGDPRRTEPEKLKTIIRQPF